MSLKSFEVVDCCVYRYYMRIFSTVILMLTCLILHHSSSASDELDPDRLPFEAKRIFQKFLIAEKDIQKKLVDSLVIQVREYEKRGDKENVERVTKFLDEFQLSAKKQVQDRQRAKIKCDEKFVSFRKGIWFTFDHPTPFTIVPKEFVGERVSMRHNQTKDNIHSDLFFEVVKEGNVFIMIRDHFHISFAAEGWEFYCDAEYGEFPPIPLVILKKFLSPGKYSLPSKGHIGTRIFDL